MRALIIVDLQIDFVTGGKLAVPQGEQIVPLVNELAGRFDLVVATQDWHPPRTPHFMPDGPWPVHCVGDTWGAELHPAFELPADAPRVVTFTSNAADAEILGLTVAAMAAAGLERYRVRIGDLGLVRALLHSLDMPERWRRRLMHQFWRPRAFRSLLDQDQHATLRRAATVRRRESARRTSADPCAARRRERVRRRRPPCEYQAPGRPWHGRLRILPW